MPKHNNFTKTINHRQRAFVFPSKQHSTHRSVTTSHTIGQAKARDFLLLESSVRVQLSKTDEILRSARQRANQSTHPRKIFQIKKSVNITYTHATTTTTTSSHNLPTFCPTPYHTTFDSLKYMHAWTSQSKSPGCHIFREIRPPSPRKKKKRFASERPRSSVTPTTESTLNTVNESCNKNRFNTRNKKNDTQTATAVTENADIFLPQMKVLRII